MVRVLTFVGLCAGTYVGVKALDNLVIWMAERRGANVDKYKLEREAYLLKQQLIKELQEKQAM
ncbi:unnamed protein product [Calypogeia fissa]